MLKKKSSYLILAIVVVICSVFFGVLFENKKFFPYLELKSIYLKVNKEFKKTKSDKIKKNIEETSLFNEFEILDFKYTNFNAIETSTIKLERKELDLKKFFPKSSLIKARGGICSLEEFTIVVSSSGESILINNKNNTLLFFDLGKYFKSKNFKIKIFQDIYCQNITKNNTLSFLVNFMSEEVLYKEKNYEAKYASNIHQVNLIDLSKIESESVFKSKQHGENWAGRLIIKENNLYISFSSRDANKEDFYEIPLSQDERYLEGKILEVDLKNKTNSIYSSGHRNPQGLVLTSDDQILSTEHGPKGGDELNLIKKGNNYGWPIVTHGTTYESFKAYDYANVVPGRHDGFEKPLFSWSPGIGISSLIEVKNFDPRWDRDFLISSLKNMSLYRVRLENNNSLLFSERIWIGNRIRDVSINNNGEIFLWTDDKKIIKLKKNLDNNNLRLVKSYDITTLNVCLTCHYLNSGEKPSTKLIAPTLSKIFERDIASDQDFDYSDSLKKIKGKWNNINLAQYLLDPQNFSPGTYKSYKGKNSSEVFKIIEELEKLSASGD